MSRTLLFLPTPDEDDGLCEDCRPIYEERPESYPTPNPSEEYSDWEDQLCDGCKADNPTLGDAVRQTLGDLDDVPPDVIVTLHHLFSMLSFALEENEEERCLYALRYLAASLYPRAQARVEEWITQ